MVLERYRAVVLWAAFVAVAAVMWAPAVAYSDDNAPPPPPATQPEEEQEEAQEEAGRQPLKLAESLSVTVTLHAFSGVPDPKWPLNARQIARLASLVDRFKPVNLDKPLEPPSRLGYKGCSLKIKPKEGPRSTLFVYDDTIQGGKSFGSRKGTGHRLERWLVSTAGKTVKRIVKRETLRDISKLSRGSGRNLNRRPPANTNAPEGSSPRPEPEAPK